MTTCDGERFLPGQLRTIDDQTRPVDEIVIFDDASTDGTWAILSEFASTRPHVRLSRQSSRTGLFTNVQQALAGVTGDVVVLADQDDEWLPDKVAQIESAFADPGVTLWFSDATLIDEQGMSLDRTAWQAVRFDESARVALCEHGRIERLLHGQTVSGATMAVRAALLEVALPMPAATRDPEAGFLHDGWLAVLAAVAGRTVAIERPLTRYRQHATQTTHMHQTALANERRSGQRRTVRVREEQLRADAARTGLVADRCRSTPLERLGRPAAVAELIALERFVRARVTPSRARRIPLVMTAVARGDYRRFARGLRTALYDLSR